jgi:hypothetical protein
MLTNIFVRVSLVSRGLPWHATLLITGPYEPAMCQPRSGTTYDVCRFAHLIRSSKTNHKLPLARLHPSISLAHNSPSPINHRDDVACRVGMSLLKRICAGRGGRTGSLGQLWPAG